MGPVGFVTLYKINSSSNINLHDFLLSLFLERLCLIFNPRNLGESSSVSERVTLELSVQTLLPLATYPDIWTKKFYELLDDFSMKSGLELNDIKIKVSEDFPEILAQSW